MFIKNIRIDRPYFIKLLATLPFSGVVMNLHGLNKLSATISPTPKMPVLFLGHGNPMNAIEENEFVSGFRKIANEIPKPNAIFCISAHWETNGTSVTAMEMPRTIHDFSGFPKELYEVQYPAPGSRALAQEIKKSIMKTSIGLDEKWGLDHGSWSVIKHLYPKANIPVIQMSLDYTQSAQYHYELAQELASLRQKGILIIGSGNMVHNLGLIAWNKLKDDNYAFDWALEASNKMRNFIINNDHHSLINYSANGRAFQLAIPTPEHYLPLLYVLALKEEKENIALFNDKAVAGSLTMTSVKIGD